MVKIKSEELPLDCTRCKYMHIGFVADCKDGGRWFECVHPLILEDLPNGRVISDEEAESMDLPEWCQLLNRDGEMEIFICSECDKEAPEKNMILHNGKIKTVCSACFEKLSD